MNGRAVSLAALSAALTILSPALGQAPARASTATMSPLVKLLTVTNASTFSTSWAAIQAAHLDQYLSNPALDVTFFVPTNEAWQKRLPSMTRPNWITVKDLFSEGKSFVMDSILKYHMMQSVYQYDELTDQTRLTTLSNLCSFAKDLKVSRPADVTSLISGGGSQGTILSRGIPVGKSMVYPIDDVLLPQVVTVSLDHALETFTSGAQKLSPTLQRNAGFLNALQELVAQQPLAPTAAPGTFLTASDLAQPPPQSTTNSAAAQAAPAEPSSDAGGVDAGSGATPATQARNMSPAQWASPAATTASAAGVALAQQDPAQALDVAGPTGPRGAAAAAPSGTKAASVPSTAQAASPAAAPMTSPVAASPAAAQTGVTAAGPASAGAAAGPSATVASPAASSAGPERNGAAGPVTARRGGAQWTYSERAGAPSSWDTPNVPVTATKTSTASATTDWGSSGKRLS